MFQNLQVYLEKLLADPKLNNNTFIGGDGVDIVQKKVSGLGLF